VCVFTAPPRPLTLTPADACAQGLVPLQFSSAEAVVGIPLVNSMGVAGSFVGPLLVAALVGGKSRVVSRTLDQFVCLHTRSVGFHSPVCGPCQTSE
jgi:hypothetical protein